jgi:hypothetical protein
MSGKYQHGIPSGRPATISGKYQHGILSGRPCTIDGVLNIIELQISFALLNTEERPECIPC